MDCLVPLLNLKKMYHAIKSEIDSAISMVLEECSFVGGPFLSKFEREFASYQGALHCLGVGNGTDALEIALESLCLPPHSEIIVPANSFIASSECISRQGHEVVFCDVKEDDYTLNLDDLEKRITPRTKAIIAVHLYGHPCKMDDLMSLARKYQLKVIEDASQAHGAFYKNKPIGSWGNLTCFSFYPAKNLGAFGDGGAIITNETSLDEACRKISNHGRASKYQHVFEGRNSRLDGIQAAVLSVKLNHLDSWIEKRRSFASLYKKELGDIKTLILPQEKKDVHHAYHLFVIRHSKRDQLKNFLAEKGIETGIHYPISLPQLEAYNQHKSNHEFFLANKLSQQILSLPIGEHLEEKDIHYVINCIRSFDQHG